MKIKAITTLFAAALLGTGLAVAQDAGDAGDAVTTTAAPAPAPAEAPAAAPASGATSEDELAKKLANPIASLISVPFQSNFDFGGGPNGDSFQWKMNVQPVIPISLDDEWNLITRTIIPVISQDDIAGTPDNPSGSQTGIGDTSVSMWFSPKEPNKMGWIWGVGPVALLNTGTDSDNFIGGNQWGLGPTAILLKQQGAFTYGTLLNHLWNVGGTDGRPETNATFIQPFLAVNPGGGWTYTVNTETTYDWTASQFTIPINLAVSKMFKIGETHAQWQLGGRYYADKGDLGPEWGFRFNVTLLFPQ